MRFAILRIRQWHL